MSGAERFLKERDLKKSWSGANYLPRNGRPRLDLVQMSKPTQLTISLTITVVAVTMATISLITDIFRLIPDERTTTLLLLFIYLFLCGVERLSGDTGPLR